MRRDVLVAGPGAFEDMPLGDAVRLMFEVYILMPVRQMRASGEDAYYGALSADDAPGGPCGYVTAIEGEDEPVTALWVTPDGSGLRACWWGLDKWDALVPR